ncbi:MAG: MAPEG family protein [Spirulinaceae cyanobacterium RM2_2_10]|nr:MAPEG family protein [Spirulinaceae cyanobacterium SM2_1_0]NJO20533.1 MAPEG family protein [Spirulinaceae cyanobacterium RM2_2_10]
MPPLPVDLMLVVSLFGAVVLVYFPFLWVGYARVTAGYDISAPRAMFDQLPPYAQRATWAHQNGFEALTIYAVAALSAYVTGVDSTLAVGAAIAFLVARLLYAFCYIFDQPLLRSLMFAIGSLSSFLLLALSLQQVWATV